MRTRQTLEPRPANGSNVIPRRACPGLAGLGPHRPLSWRCSRWVDIGHCPARFVLTPQPLKFLACVLFVHDDTPLSDLTQRRGLLVKEAATDRTLGRFVKNWNFIAEQQDPAPHLAHPQGFATLCIVLVTVPRVSRSCEYFPDGFDVHLLRLLCGDR